MYSSRARCGLDEVFSSDYNNAVISHSGTVTAANRKHHEEVELFSTLSESTARIFQKHRYTCKFAKEFLMSFCEHFRRLLTFADL